VDYLPVLIAVAAVALTYLFCIRPMRRGACHTSGDQQLARELELARTELELLRLQRAAEGGTLPTTT
jgi:hypothetical protein